MCKFIQFLGVFFSLSCGKRFRIQILDFVMTLDFWGNWAFGWENDIDLINACWFDIPLFFIEKNWLQKLIISSKM